MSEIERPLVDCLPGDRGPHALVGDRTQGAYIVEVGHAAGSDDRDGEPARELHRAFHIQTAQHAVAADVGVDDRGDAVVFELLRQIERVVTRQLGPALNRHLAVSDIQPNDDVAGVFEANILNKMRCGHSLGTDDYKAHAGVEIRLDGVLIADPAAHLYRHARTGLDQPVDDIGIGGCAVDRTVEVNHMQTAGAGIDPASGHLHRVVGVNRFGIHLALHQSHTATTFDIDSGYQQHDES